MEKLGIKELYKGNFGSIRESNLYDFEMAFQRKEAISIKGVYEGSENYQINNRYYQVTPHYLLLFNEGFRYIAQNNSQASGVCIDLNPSLLASAEKDIFEEEKLFDLSQEFSVLKIPVDHYGLQSGLLYLKNTGTNLSKLQLEESFSPFLEALLLMESDFNQKIHALPALKKSVKKELFRKLLLARNYIHDHRFSNLSLHEIAYAAGLSKFYFQRLFKRVFKTSPGQYMENLKMQEAKQLLRKNTLNITEVAYFLGYNDVQYFSNRFKKYFGVSPSFCQNEFTEK